VDENETAARSSRGIFRKKNQIIRKGSSGLVPLPGGRVRDDNLELIEIEVEGEGGEKNGLAEALGDGQGLVARERGGDDDTLTLSVDIDQVGDAESPMDDVSVETGALIMQGGVTSHSYALSTPPTVRVSGWDANTGDLTPDTQFLVGQGKLRRGSAVLGSSFKGVECDSFVATPRSVGAGEEEEVGLSTERNLRGGELREEEEEERREAEGEHCAGEELAKEMFTSEHLEFDHSGTRNDDDHSSINGGAESIYGEPETPPSSDDMDVDLAATTSLPCQAITGGDDDGLENGRRLDQGKNVEIEVWHRRDVYHLLHS